MKRSLKNLLSGDPNSFDDEVDDQNSDQNSSYEEVENDSGPLDERLCIECGDQPSEVLCVVCSEKFCSVCFEFLHRTGRRKLHEKKPLQSSDGLNHEDGQTAKADSIEETKQDDEDMDVDIHSEEAIASAAQSISSIRTGTVLRSGTATPNESGAPMDEQSLLLAIKEHARYVPLRLTVDERKLLHLLEAALNVSEYTDKVDILVYSNKTKRMVAQLKEMCSILAGLVVASDMKIGQTLFQNQEYAANADWFKSVFEIGRRYKVMNPEKMRDSFGKLVYMIMDSRLPEVKEAMEFDLYKPIKTVYNYLEENGAVKLLDDPLILQATIEINPQGRNRASVQSDIRRKEKAIEALATRYGKSAKTFLLKYGTSFNLGKKENVSSFADTSSLSQEDIRQCLYSIGDYHAYLRANRFPIEQLIKGLHSEFDPEEVKRDMSLGIHYGSQGARLSHNHSKQYHYVHQSLTLWSQIMRDMFMLWMLADDDLLSSKTRYRLADTGQGLNRIKPCPQVSRAMHGIINKTQKRTGSWVGSSVVHLGDHTVPNALFFLDKYLQVPRILTPVHIVLSSLDGVARDPFVHDWICAQFISVDNLKLVILCDFFKHAFDGSGADNFYDAGSCIDGRLTSAWNWGNSIAKKPYYKMFLLCGFTGFNGTDGF